MGLLNKYIEQVKDNQEIINWINTTLNARLQKQPAFENQGEIEHILDFMQSDKAPKRLQKMSYDQAKISAEKWVKSLVKKGKHIDDTSQIEIIKKYKSGLRLVRLVGKDAYEREGKLMAHCAASYYGRDVEIYSIRDEKNEPHCTIELQRSNGLIQQIKGKGNGSIHPRYIKTVLAVLKHFNMKVNENDMTNLDYIKLEDYEVKELLPLITNAKTLVLKSVTYLFNG